LADGEVAFLDTESYANAALFMCQTEGGRLFKAWVEGPNGPAADYVRAVMASGYTFVTFNGINYDMPVVSAMIDGRGPHEIKHLSNRIIEGGLMPWEAADEFRLPPNLAGVDHIDLIGVRPPNAGLKMAAARMGSPHLEENPIDHRSEIAPAQYPGAERYCMSDLRNTRMLFGRCEQPLLLRCQMSREYGVDLRSKSDAQVAEQVFVKKLGLKRKWGENARIPPVVRYRAPAWAQSFQSPGLRALVARLEDTIFHVHQGSGHVAMPSWLEAASPESRLTSRTGVFQMGVGGLHSTHDKKVCHVAGPDWRVTDVDWDSYYPTLIVNADPEILPPHLGEAFITEYDNIRRIRLEAKRVKDVSKADSLRIAVNGTFGKLMSRWSPLYAPGLGLYTTLTGQLGLLGAVYEVLEPAGCSILSANTDGIVIGHPAGVDAAALMAEYAAVMSEGGRAPYGVEATSYRTIAMKDVNNYIAVKAKDRSVKAKGLYAPLDKMMKNPTLPVCSEAVGKWLAHGVPFERTLAEAHQRRYLPDWLAARRVNGGGVQGEKTVGSLVRWYLSTDPGLPPLTYALNGNRVPKTEGVRACMIFDPAAPLPADLDTLAYNKECIRIAKDLGCSQYLSEEQLVLVAPPPKAGRKRKAVTESPEKEASA